jgi:hypothetical protein
LTFTNIDVQKQQMWTHHLTLRNLMNGFPFSFVDLIVGNDKYRMEDVLGFRMDMVTLPNIDGSSPTKVTELADRLFIDFYGRLDGKTWSDFY